MKESRIPRYVEFWILRASFQKVHVHMYSCMANFQAAVMQILWTARTAFLLPAECMHARSMVVSAVPAVLVPVVPIELAMSNTS